MTLTEPSIIMYSNDWSSTWRYALLSGDGKFYIIKNYNFLNFEVIKNLSYDSHYIY